MGGTYLDLTPEKPEEKPEDVWVRSMQGLGVNQLSRRFGILGLEFRVQGVGFKV